MATPAVLVSTDPTASSHLSVDCDLIEGRRNNSHKYEDAEHPLQIRIEEFDLRRGGEK